MVFGGNYYLDRESFLHNSIFNRLPAINYKHNADGYLKGVEIIRDDFRNILKNEKFKNSLLILDPPYLNTEDKIYKGKFKKDDFLELISLLRKNKQDFIFFHCENEFVDSTLKENFKLKVIKKNLTINSKNNKKDCMYYAL